MCVCVCVCYWHYVCICMWSCYSICVHACWCVCMCVCRCMCVHAYMHMCLCVCARVRLRVCNPVNVCASLCFAWISMFINVFLCIFEFLFECHLIYMLHVCLYLGCKALLVAENALSVPSDYYYVLVDAWLQLLPSLSHPPPPKFPLSIPFQNPLWVKMIKTTFCS